MQRALQLLSFLLVFGLVLPAAADHLRTQHTAAQTVGVTIAGGQGDLVTCAAGETHIVGLTTYLFFQGVCDNLGERPCNGRLTQIVEGCIGAASIAGAGNLVSVAARGRSRICWDPAGQGDCTGADPLGKVVARGSNLVQLRQRVAPGPDPMGPPVPVEVEGNDDLTIRWARFFRVDGRRTRIRLDGLFFHFLSEPDTAGDNCGLMGCGFTATAEAVD